MGNVVGLSKGGSLMFWGGGIRLHTTRTSCHRKLQVWYLVEIMVIIEKNQQSE